MKISKKKMTAVFSVIAMAGLTDLAYANQEKSTGQSREQKQSEKINSSGQSMEGKSTDKMKASGQSKENGQAKAQKQGEKDSSSGQSREQNNTPIVVVTTWAFDTTGCWVTFYDKENLSGNAITVTGPNEMSTMNFPAFVKWDGRINSLEVGPNAIVTLYGQPNFQDPDFSFAGNVKELNLERLPSWDRLQSMKLSCSSTN